MGPKEYQEREEERNKGFVRTFGSWKQTFYLMTTNVLAIEENGSSDELKHTREQYGLWGIMDVIDRLTDEFEEKYKDEDWHEVDYIETTEQFAKENLK